MIGVRPGKASAWLWPALALVACLDAEATQSATGAGSRRLELEVTPGKPGAPTERLTIEATAAPEQCTRRLERIGGDGKVIATDTAPVPQKAFDEMWSLATGLCANDAPSALPLVNDYGEQRLRVASHVERASFQLELRWQSPLAATSPKLTAMVMALTTHAARTDKVEFFYLPRAPK